MAKKNEVLSSDYRIYVGKGSGPAWKRTIVVHITGKVWVPGIGGFIQDALFNGDPMLECEGRTYVALDDVLKYPMEDSERTILTNIKNRYGAVVLND